MGVVEDFVIVLEWGVPLECDSKISMTVFVPLDLITLTDADFRLVHAGRSHIYILVATIGMGVPGAYCSQRGSRALLLVIAPDDEKANQWQGNSNDTSGRKAQSFDFNPLISFGETGSGQ